MGKNDWKKYNQEPKEASETPQEQAEQPLEASPAESEPTQEAVKTHKTETALVDLGTYARLNILGYKEHWWHSIERYARGHGLKSYRVSEAKAKEVLSGWGAKFK